MVMVYIWQQSRYDTFHPSSDRLYRVYLDSKLGGLESKVAVSSPMFANGLKPYLPEIERSCRIFKNDRDIPVVIPVTALLDRRTLLYVDSTFFDIFGFKLLEGDPKSCLSQPRSIVLSQSIANQLFPNGALGKVLTVENDKKWTVTGVVENCPVNSHLNYKSLVSISSVDLPDLRWTSLYLYTYFRFKQGTDMDLQGPTPYLGLTAIESKLLNGFLKEAGEELEKSMGLTIDQMKENDEYFVLRLQKVSDIHLFSNLKYEISQNVNIQTVLIIGGISILIILIACINYANLSIARLAGRVREIGIRKIMGSQRSELSLQLLAESVTISFISLFFALVLVELVYPNTILASQNSVLDIEHLLLRLAPIIFVVTFMTGILAGIYPAFYIIRFSPATILSHQKQFSIGGKGLRGILVILQFVFSLVIIYSTSTIYRQLRYVQQNSVGFEKDKLLVIQNVVGLEGDADRFRENLLGIKGVQSVTYSNAIPGKSLGMQSVQNGNDRLSNLMMYMMQTDSLFFKTYGMNLVQGSYHTDAYRSADSVDVIINEEAVKYLGFKHPVGERIFRKNNDTSTHCLIIKGVVANFNFESLHAKIQPLIIFPGGLEKIKFATIRFSDTVKDSDLKQIRKFLDNHYPSIPFFQFSMNETFGDFYKEEKATGEVAVVFSFFAIFIACMGLYSLLALITVFRTKEIGIRKVLGAGTKELVLLLSKEIFKLITIAGIIALPIAFLLSYYWLDRFAYHVSLSIGNYVAVFLAVFFVAVFTIYRQLWHTINSDPGDSLRFE
jgi:putative ABC transport system permease protein